MSAIIGDEYFNNYNLQRTYPFNPPRPDGGLWSPYGGPTGGSGAAGARRFTNTSASGLGNIHPDRQVGQDWGKRRPLLGDTASQQNDENVTTEDIKGPRSQSRRNAFWQFFSYELHICSIELHDGCHVCCLYW